MIHGGIATFYDLIRLSASKRRQRICSRLCGIRSVSAMRQSGAGSAGVQHEVLSSFNTEQKLLPGLAHSALCSVSEDNFLVFVEED